MSPVQPPKAGGKGSPNPNLLQDARARDEAERRDKHRNEQLGDACAKIEEELELLKGRYELYFLGIDRREPARERDEMKRRVARLKGEFTRNTGLRFRIETIHARFLAYERMWLRSSREKEDGTYRRDLLRARRHRRGAAEPNGDSAAKPGAPADAEPSAAQGSQRSQEVASAKAKSAPLGPVQAPAPPTTTAAGPSGLTPEQLRSLYDAYVDAKKRCNEDVSRVSYEALAKTIAKQVPELITKYRARSVEFRVVIKDGRAILKAVPRA